MTSTRPHLSIDAAFEIVDAQDLPDGAYWAIPELRGDERRAEGRYVHAWNNIGLVVRDDGTFAYVSF